MSVVDSVANMISDHRALIVRDYQQEMVADCNGRMYLKNPHVKKRKCLKCGVIFDSNHIGHRICGLCVHAEKKKRQTLRGYEHD